MRLLCKTFFYTLIFCKQIFLAYSQDVGFSQFYDQPFLRNPALAGVFTGDVRGTAAFRNQWEKVTIPYRTFGLSGELKIPLDIITDDNLTIGFQAMKDIAGTSNYSTLEVQPAINYSLPLSSTTNSYLSLGFMGGLRQQKFDHENLVLNDQFIAGTNGTFSFLPSSQQVFGKTTANYFDISTGLSYNGTIRNADFYFGVGLFHLTNPQVGFFDNNKILLNKKFALNFGLSAPLSEDDQFIVYGDYFAQYKEKKRVGISTIQAGLMMSHNFFLLGDDQKSITGGVIYRLDDALIPVIKLELSRFIFGVSYDVNINKLVVASNYRGGLELTLSYRNFLNYRNSDLRQTRCPKFGRMPWLADCIHPPPALQIPVALPAFAGGESSSVRHSFTQNGFIWYW